MDHYTYIKGFKQFFSRHYIGKAKISVFNGLNIDVTVWTHRVGDIAKITSRPRNQQDKTSSQQ